MLGTGAPAQRHRAPRAAAQDIHLGAVTSWDEHFLRSRIEAADAVGARGADPGVALPPATAQPLSPRQAVGAS